MMPTEKRSFSTIGLFPKIAAAVVAAAVVSLGCDDGAPTATRFRVRFENVAASDLVSTSNGAVDVTIGPGVYAVTPDQEVLYALDEVDRGLGMELLAEEGDPSEIAASLSDDGVDAGVYIFDSNTYEEGAIGPGAAYLFEIEAVPGERLHVASMLVISNDHVLATLPAGIELFEGNSPREGDVTASLGRIDVGTEQDEALGEGPGQPMVGGHGAGVATNDPAVEVLDAPTASEMVRVTLSVVSR